MESPKRRILRNFYFNYTTEEVQLNCRNATTNTTTAAAAKTTTTTSTTTTTTITTSTTNTTTGTNSIPLFIYLRNHSTA